MTAVIPNSRSHNLVSREVAAYYKGFALMRSALAGSALVGSALVGSASVGSALVGSALVGSASLGSALVGSALVGSASAYVEAVTVGASRLDLQKSNCTNQVFLIANNNCKKNYKFNWRSTPMLQVVEYL